MIHAGGIAGLVHCGPVEKGPVYIISIAVWESLRCPLPLQHCMPMTAAECSVCGREALMLCSGCQLQHYCCRKCQKRHWKHHHRSVCFPNISQSSAELEVSVCLRLMNGTSKKTVRVDSTSSVSLLYSLAEAWVMEDDPTKMQDDDTVVVLLKDTDMLERCGTLADYYDDLPNGDAEVSIVMHEKEPPVLQDSSSEDGETDEAAAAASSASETEESSSSAEVDDFDNVMFSIFGIRKQQQQRP